MVLDTRSKMVDNIEAIGSTREVLKFGKFNTVTLAHRSEMEEAAEESDIVPSLVFLLFNVLLPWRVHQFLSAE